MKTKRKNCQSASITTKVVKTEEELLLIASIERRMSIANRSASSCRSYVRAVVRLFHFHDVHPKDLELDQILDFLLFMKNEKGLHWRTIKLYVAGLRYSYQEIVGAIELAQQIWQTIDAFAMDKRQKMEAKPGVIAILHTWNQKIQYHPHIHCIIPAGGINKKGEWKTTKGKEDFLFHVKALSTKFKKKFLHHLVELYKANKLTIPPNDSLWNTATSFYKTKSKLYNKDWVVYGKESFGGPNQVMEYLGRYTHKIAISNHRILKITDSHVTFSYLDRNNNKIAAETIKGEVFLLRFLQHLLPKRFVKIRYYGFLSTRSKKVDLAKIRHALKVTEIPPKVILSTREVLIQSKNKDPYLCPKCGKDTMVVVEIIAGIRGSPRLFFAKDKKIQLEK